MVHPPKATALLGQQGAAIVLGPETEMVSGVALDLQNVHFNPEVADGN